MSGKYDVVDGGIVECHSARVLGPDDRQRHGSSDLPALRLQDLLHAAQDEGSRRTALTRRSRLQLAVHSVRNIDRRAHGTILPYLWQWHRLSNGGAGRAPPPALGPA